MWILKSLRTDAFFWLSILLAVVGLLVPQIWQVVSQPVEAPALSPEHPFRDLPALLVSQSTWEAAGFLIYLSLLSTTLAASILFVVPPSFVASSDNPAEPIRLPRPPGRRLLGATLLLLGLLPLFVLLHIPPVILIALTVVLLFRRISRFVGRQSGWLVRVARSAPPGARRWGGGAVLVVGIVLFLLGPWAERAGSRLYPLAGTASPLFGTLGVLTGLWLLTIPRAAPDDADPVGTVRVAMGRLLGWLIAAGVLGEVIWGLAFVPGAERYVSLRLYTIWAALTLPVLLILTGSLLDTWEGATGYPVRLFGVLAGVLVLLTVSPREPLRQPPRPAPAPVPPDWPAYLLARVNTIPRGEPVVFVAAAGGGSRAAIFAGLVLESLAREPFPGQRPSDTWADHIVLVSGVSGGSLGSATFIQRSDKLAAVVRARGNGGQGSTDPAVERGDLKNSVKAELILRMEDEAKALMQQIEDQANEPCGVPSADYLEASKTTLAFCQQLHQELLDKQKSDGEGMPSLSRDDLCQKSREDLLKQGGADGWVLRSTITDDLCTDFMAPVFRGVLAPETSRGEALRDFWANQFAWGASSDRGGYGSNVEAPRYDPRAHPAAVYNATDVRRGCRIAIGFPPLPAGLLQDDAVKAARDAVPAPGPRNLPETLADVNPDTTLALSEAVGLSANFPFGFNPTTIPRAADKCNTPKLLEESGDQVAKVLDGGIVDNTGIDTVFRIVKAIEGRARAATPGYVELWQALRERPVVLIEIDSGAKPEKPGLADRWFSVVLDPLAALTNAGYTGDGLTRQHYLSDLDAAFRLRVSLDEQKKQLAAQGRGWTAEDQKVWDKLSQLEAEGVRHFSSFSYSANHFNADNVLTAWSLAPSDKARLLVRFLVERQVARASLLDIAHSALCEAGKERTQVEARASELVKARLARKPIQPLLTAKPRPESLQSRLNRKAEVCRRLFDAPATAEAGGK